MKIAVFSDVHGNIFALRAVLEAIQPMAVDEIYCAGDLINGGAGGEEIVLALNAAGVQCVMGNHDEFTIHPELMKRFPPHIKRIARELLAWAEKHLSAGSFDFLANLPITREVKLENGQKLLITHSTPGDAWSLASFPDADYSDVTAAYAEADADIICHGHIHGHNIRQIAGKLLVNVSSVGMEADHLANFTVIESDPDRVIIKQHRIPYEWEAELALEAELGVPG